MLKLIVILIGLWLFAGLFFHLGMEYTKTGMYNKPANCFEAEHKNKQYAKAIQKAGIFEVWGVENGKSFHKLVCPGPPSE